jgi:sentrin-specific protease 8
MECISFKDAVIWENDVELFAPGQWLNDSCINWCFRQILDEEEGAEEDVLLMDPSVVSFMMTQCETAEEEDELVQGQSISSKKVICLPVSDNEGFSSGSSHWSLLLCCAPTNSNGNPWRFFVSFDSSSSYNSEAAERVAKKFAQICCWPEPHPGVIHAKNCPQQTNGYDCGMYVILMARWIVQNRQDLGQLSEAGIEHVCTNMVKHITPQKVSMARNDALKKIVTLFKSKQVT